MDVAVGTFMTYGGKLIRKVGSYFIDKETGLIPYMDVFQPLGMSWWMKLELKIKHENRYKICHIIIFLFDFSISEEEDLSGGWNGVSLYFLVFWLKQRNRLIIFVV